MIVNTGEIITSFFFQKTLFTLQSSLISLDFLALHSLAFLNMQGNPVRNDSEISLRHWDLIGLGFLLKIALKLCLSTYRAYV